MIKNFNSYINIVKCYSKNKFKMFSNKIMKLFKKLINKILIINN